MTECFTILADEIEGRLDCHFYRPEFTKLEKKIKGVSKKKLADYVLSISGGATPNIKESDKYYTDSADGVPFLRVHNVTPEGLNFDDLKFINRETHNGMLKRSQVNENNLLVKITGVGRMAVSSVAPKGFIGNINQHLVVIKTENENTSKVLAVFLNSDIGEKLATKRSTGGTRPALDYEALKSIPILFKPETVAIYEKAIIQKKKIESQAQQLLDSINDYVLDELGIKLSELEDKMTYIVNSDEVQNKRADAYYYQPKFEEAEKAVKKGKFEVKELKDFLEYYKKGIEVGSSEYLDEGVPFVRVADIDNYKINLDKADKKISLELFEKLKGDFNPKKDEILYSKDGTIGFCVVVNENKDFIISGGILRLKEKRDVNNLYLKTILSTSLFKLLAEKESIGAIIKHLTPDSLFIPKNPPAPSFYPEQNC